MDPVECYLDEVRAVCPTLDRDELAFLAGGLSVVVLPAGAVFTAPGMVQQVLGHVVQGLLKAVHVDENGNEINVNFLQERMTAGHYQAFIERGASRYRFQCIEPSTLVQIPREHFEACSMRLPRIERFYRRQVEQALFFYLHRTEELLFVDARRRYAHFMQRNPALAARLSVTDLCSYLGMRRQTLTRIRQELEGGTGGREVRQRR